MVSGVPSGYAFRRSAIAGVLRTNTPSPSVLPTHTVSVFAATTTVVAVGRGAADGDATGEAAARATVGTIVGATVDSGVGGEPVKPPNPPHALTSNARLPAPRSVRQPVMYLAGYSLLAATDPFISR